MTTETEAPGLDDLDTKTPVAEQFLNEAKDELRLDTDYKLAKYLKVSQSRLNNYRSGRTKPDEGMCLMLERILEGRYPRGYILMRMQAARSADPAVRLRWEDVADRSMKYWKSGGPFLVALVALAVVQIAPGAEGVNVWTISALLAALPVDVSIHYTNVAALAAAALIMLRSLTARPQERAQGKKSDKP